jgi:hypothetical protein
MHVGRYSQVFAYVRFYTSFMKTHFTTMLVIAAFLSLKSQSNFQGLYDSGFNYNDNGYYITSTPDGMLVMSATLCKDDTGGIYYCTPIFKTNLEGIIQWEKIYDDYPDGLSINQILKIDDGFISCGTNVLLDSYEPYLMKLSESGDSLWRVTYSDSLKTYMPYILNHPNGGYMVMGQGSIGPQLTHIFLMRTDTAGNELWTKVVETGYPQNAPHNFHLLPNGDIVVGFEGSPINNQTDFASIIVTDSLGNIKWVKSYHSEPYFYCNAWAYPLQNGGFALTYCQDTTVNIFNRPTILFGTDSVGNVAWKYTFPISRHEHFASFVASNGDIIGCGERVVQEPGPYQGQFLGWLFRMSQDGELLWQRGYVPEHIINPNNSRAQFNHVTETPDGGIAVVGIAPDTVGGVGGTDVWLVKVGPDGCFEPGCTEEIVLSPVSSAGEGVLVSDWKAQVVVYPNPATSQVTVSLPIPLRKGAVWSLHDQLGREMRRAVLSAGQQEVEVSVGDVPPGMYFWQVESEGRHLESGKLIIQQ